MRQKEQRVGIFIDVQNLYHSAKNLYKARVNFKELLKNLLSGRKLIRVIAYVVRAEHVDQASRHAENGAKSASPEATFFDALKQAGIELRMKDIQVFAGGAKKADWDVGMAVDAIRMATFLDAVILVTGDGDFVPLVDYLKWGMGRVVEVSAFSKTTNSKLKESADQFIAIEDIPKALIRK
ncbi:MAG: NYN domain-containing protein [Patescibacteria group bacterium]